MNEKILKIKNLTIALPKNADRQFAVEDANLDVFKGEILFIVGESGSGKSVMTSAILNDIPKGLSVTSSISLQDNLFLLPSMVEVRIVTPMVNKLLYQLR